MKVCPTDWDWVAVVIIYEAGVIFFNRLILKLDEFERCSYIFNGCSDDKSVGMR